MSVQCTQGSVHSVEERQQPEFDNDIFAVITPELEEELEYEDELEKMKELTETQGQKLEQLQAVNEKLLNITADITDSFKGICSLMNNNSIVSEIEKEAEKDGTLEEKLTQLKFWAMKMKSTKVQETTKKNEHTLQQKSESSSSKSREKSTTAVDNTRFIVRPFQCYLCSRSFKSKGYIRVHVQRVHKSVRPYECAVCGRTFKGKWDIEAHIRGKHNGTRPIACKECDSTFKFKSVLKKHMRIVHNA